MISRRRPAEAHRYALTDAVVALLRGSSELDKVQIDIVQFS
ncbi:MULTISPECIES: hypothetical protein [unclassified Streptomyces]